MLNRNVTFAILKFLNKTNRGFTKSQLKTHLKDLNLTSKEFDKVIKELKNLKVLHKTKHRNYILNKSYDYIDGTYVVTKNAKFVAGYNLNGTLVQYKISDINNNDCLYKDRVLAIPIGKGECKILYTFEHYNTKLTGTYIDSDNYGFVLLDNKNYSKDIYISSENKNGAMSYDRVEVEILPNSIGKNPEGKITKVYGLEIEKDDVLTLETILEKNHINTKHSTKALNQIKKMISYDKDNLDFELKNRKDLTNEIIFTIDGIDSKDLDDAISIKKLENDNFLLGVHIADVSHYVTEHSKLDEEALQRGTSIYLIDTVIPMLPPILSNGLCSLNPNELRLTLSVEMEIDKNGNVVNHNIFESYIKSKAKLNYPQVTNFLENKDKEFEIQYPEIAKSLLIMKDLMYILNQKRISRGCIEFESDESKIELDDNKNVISVKKYDRGISNDLIEEFMLICNETIAEHFMKLQLPFVFRIHEIPKEEKFIQWSDFISKYGYNINIDYEHLTPKIYQNLLNDILDKDEYLPISIMTLRTMQQARYKEYCNLHFGLAANYYCHFTSPIRRYPDLQIHRIIKESLNNKIDDFRKKELEEIVTYVAKECSKKERIANNIEEEYTNLKKAEFMEDNINEFEGIITNISNNFVEITLDNTIVGKLKLKKNEHIFDTKEYVIKKDKKILYELGQKIQVKVDYVSLSTTEIFFKIP